jgi:hypothetical protein
MTIGDRVRDWLYAARFGAPQFRRSARHAERCIHLFVSVGAVGDKIEVPTHQFAVYELELCVALRLTGLDSNREHIFSFATRPNGFDRNTLSTPMNIGVDSRVLKMIPLHGGHLDVVAESFNLNHRNVTLLNACFGSNGQSGSGFKTPIATSTGRRIQFSLDCEF